LIVAILLKGLRMARSRVTASFSTSATHIERVFATFGMAFGLSYLLYNITEATFQGLNFLFVMFLVLAFDGRQLREPVKGLSRRPRTARWDERVKTGPV
jgi:hypothetical protein